MTTPRVTELPLRLESSGPDAFIETLTRASPAQPQAVADRRRRLELVRRLLAGSRNGRGGRATERP